MLGRDALAVTEVSSSGMQSGEPRAGDDSRVWVAFVGQSVYFASARWSELRVASSRPSLTYRAGFPAAPLLARVQDARSGRRRRVPPGDNPARAVRVAARRHDRLPDRAAATPSGDRARRFASAALVARAGRSGNFDRIVSFDPMIVETAENVLPVWRSSRFRSRTVSSWMCASDPTPPRPAVRRALDRASRAAARAGKAQPSSSNRPRPVRGGARPRPACGGCPAEPPQQSLPVVREPRLSSPWRPVIW